MHLSYRLQISCLSRLLPDERQKTRTSPSLPRNACQIIKGTQRGIFDRWNILTVWIWAILLCKHQNNTKKKKQRGGKLPQVVFIFIAKFRLKKEFHSLASCGINAVGYFFSMKSKAYHLTPLDHSLWGGKFMFVCSYRHCQVGNVLLKKVEIPKGRGGGGSQLWNSVGMGG